MRPMIAILATNCGGTQADYVKSVERAGGCPVIIDRVEDLNTLKPIMQIVDGIIFTGGTDITPLTYNEMPKEGLGRVDSKRDEFEILLVKWVLSNTDIPILGVCRGMQILNVVDGGSLHQDLLVEKITLSNHWLSGIIPSDEHGHSVYITKKSRLYDVYKKEKIMVNSIHHQGIKNIGKSFEGTTVAEDDIIEAIEMKGERFVVGVQWHPEILVEKHPEHLALFKKFIECCYKGKEDKT
ncbi:peptidase C26 [Alkaliphilus metalliredigens QYMF]|uniref:Peptidase C26 n=1 Tax=Alkaliphilus metalliredigens (strain QYMF) TaxID=293826 RepID=A6TP85_ALKMQ|nr:gamma-glutamyl-gamma-aminobutyrate hydrolase family protein [Alkaliphilus metalliredigens]ABR48003.1 peptidase C26 [Alkaliphilus metalliredigens QYMF]